MRQAQVYKDVSGDWRWHIKAANGNLLADSGEGYKNRTDAQAALVAVLNETKEDTNVDLGEDND